MADYGPLSRRLEPAAAELVERLDPTPIEHVLDLAAGDGTVSALAARRGSRVSAIDSSPAMVAAGSARTVRDGLAVDWYEANLEDLPLPDQSIDVVASSFGLIFAPRPPVALRELCRVTVPGARLGFSAWTAAGFMGQMTNVMVPYLPAPAPGSRRPTDPTDWADPDTVTGWLHHAGFNRVTVQSASLPWRFDSPAAMTRFFQAHSPAHVAASVLAGARAADMFSAVEALASPQGGRVDADAGYVLVTAAKPS